MVTAVVSLLGGVGLGGGVGSGVGTNGSGSFWKRSGGLQRRGLTLRRYDRVFVPPEGLLVLLVPVLGLVLRPAGLSGPASGR